MDTIVPHKNELPSSFSDRLGLLYSSSVTTSHKKSIGQFFTHLEIAKYMGNLAKTSKRNIKILDPGCGPCILSCALIESLINNDPNIENIYLVTYEIDKTLIPQIGKVLSYLKEWLSDRKIIFKYKLNENDFVLDNAVSLFNHKEVNNYYDIVISNPPYFKLSMKDERVSALKNIIYGQPNIYTLFLYVAATMLNTNGELIFITPRSFASGNYYKLFRNEFFSLIQLKNVHLFGSRKDAFNKDSVLQENVILHGKKDKIRPNSIVNISSSYGIKDLEKSAIRKYKLKELINFNNGQKILHLPVSANEENIINLFKQWPGSLNKYNIQISTGPVVSFRCNELLSTVFDTTKNLVPLFILHNTQKMNFIWPIDKLKKPQYISISDKSKKLLLPNKNYILLRRFSAKDNKSRIIAAPYFSYFVKDDIIGVENHLNYIYRPNGELEKNEIIGLSLFLNSTICDTYFRTYNGNINVSAMELKEMSLPPLEIIKKIGDSYNAKIVITQNDINELVFEHINHN